MEFTYDSMEGNQNQTRAYRKRQFENVGTEYDNEYKPKIKIVKPNGETNWLDIEEAELQKIISLLTA